MGDLEAVAPTLAPELEAGDWVITLGAGNVARVGRALLALLEREDAG